MLTQIMAAYDKKARSYLTPFFVSHVDVGTRAFKDAVNNVESSVGRNPEDYSLWHLGTFNDDNGQFLIAEKPVHVCEAINLQLAHHQPQFKLPKGE